MQAHTFKITVDPYTQMNLTAIENYQTTVDKTRRCFDEQNHHRIQRH